MVFSSIYFLFLFIPIFIAAYFYFSKKSLKAGNLTLLVFSLLFYMYGEKGLVLIMVVSATIDYFAGKKISEFYLKSPESKKKPRMYLLVSIGANLGILFYFKYSNFFMETVNSVTGFGGGFIDVALPLGISFYTFQSMSYTIDVYNQKVKPSKSYFDFLTFVSMFPQLVAGPIVRYKDVADQITKRFSRKEDIEKGIIRFILGLSKKVFIANNVGFFADHFFSLPNSSLDSTGAWIGIVCYSLQIYFDFSGYSDMAIGLGRILGFHYPENFNYPYVSRSIQEFWRRWHITLSTWFRDYLYISLGGNRNGAFRTYVNQYMVFFLCGLWHGASLNFVVWGLYHGTFLTIEKALKNRVSIKVPALSHIYTILVVMVGWVFFRAETLADSVDFLKTMFSFSPLSTSTWHILKQNQLIFSVGLGIIFSAPIYKKFQSYFEGKLKFIPIIMFVICAIFLIESEYNPFIYFRF